MELIKISGKNLGELALPDFCPRCFWIKWHFKEEMPFKTPFPSIFSSIDSYTKQVTNIHYDKHNLIPKWLNEIPDLVKPMKAPSWKKYLYVDEKTQVQVHGTMDEIFLRKDNSYYIIDYKTARYSGTQDSLMPIYETQLNSYAWIGNHTMFNPVSGIGLAYYEPVIRIAQDDIDTFVFENGFYMPYICKLHQLNLDSENIVPPLLEKLRSIVDLTTAPAGRDGCDNCDRLDKLVKFIGK
jgi:hypothetical protein